MWEMGHWPWASLARALSSSGALEEFDRGLEDSFTQPIGWVQAFLLKEEDSKRPEKFQLLNCPRYVWCWAPSDVEARSSVQGAQLAQLAVGDRRPRSRVSPFTRRFAWEKAWRHWIWEVTRSQRCPQSLGFAAVVCVWGKMKDFHRSRSLGLTCPRSHSPKRESFHTLYFQVVSIPTSQGKVRSIHSQPLLHWDAKVQPRLQLQHVGLNNLILKAIKSFSRICRRCCVPLLSSNNPFEAARKLHRPRSTKIWLAKTIMFVGYNSWSWLLLPWNPRILYCILLDPKLLSTRHTLLLMREHASKTFSNLTKAGKHNWAPRSVFHSGPAQAVFDSEDIFQNLTSLTQLRCRNCTWRHKNMKCIEMPLMRVERLGNEGTGFWRYVRGRHSELLPATAFPIPFAVQNSCQASVIAALDRLSATGIPAHNWSSNQRLKEKWSTKGSHRRWPSSSSRLSLAFWSIALLGVRKSTSPLTENPHPPTKAIEISKTRLRATEADQQPAIHATCVHFQSVATSSGRDRR